MTTPIPINTVATIENNIIINRIICPSIFFMAGRLCLSNCPRIDRDQ
jgi:hypothetical protein